MDIQDLTLNIEALIFTSEKPIEIRELQEVLSITNDGVTVSEEDIENALIVLEQKYNQERFSFGLKYINNGYQFLTKVEYADIINQLFIHKSKKKLSQAALETLAIIAYKQPITKLEIELIRGVNCDYSIQKLLDKELIIISGKQNSPGKPLLYTCSDLFMNYFGLANLSDLPKLKDLSDSMNNHIGEQDLNM